MDNSTSVREAAVELLGRFVLSRPQLTEQYYDMLIERILVCDSATCKFMREEAVFCLLILLQIDIKSFQAYFVCMTKLLWCRVKLSRCMPSIMKLNGDPLGPYCNPKNKM